MKASLPTYESNDSGARKQCREGTEIERKLYILLDSIMRPRRGHTCITAGLDLQKKISRMKIDFEDVAQYFPIPQWNEEGR
jgi:hypothetical protein